MFGYTNINGCISLNITAGHYPPLKHPLIKKHPHAIALQEGVFFIVILSGLINWAYTGSFCVTGQLSLPIHQLYEVFVAR